MGLQAKHGIDVSWKDTLSCHSGHHPSCAQPGVEPWTKMLLWDIFMMFSSTRKGSRTLAFGIWMRVDFILSIFHVRYYARKAYGLWTAAFRHLERMSQSWHAPMLQALWCHRCSWWREKHTSPFLDLIPQIPHPTACGPGRLKPGWKTAWDCSGLKRSSSITVDLSDLRFFSWTSTIAMRYMKCWSWPREKMFILFHSRHIPATGYSPLTRDVLHPWVKTTGLPVAISCHCQAQNSRWWIRQPLPWSLVPPGKGQWPHQMHALASESWTYTHTIQQPYQNGHMPLSWIRRSLP